MTEANLWPLWPSYQSLIMYCFHKLGEVCTQFKEKNSYKFYLATLGATYMVTVQWRMYTIWWKSSCTLTSVAKDAWYCLYRLQSLTGYPSNSRKNNYAFWYLSMDSKPYVKLAEGCLILPSSLNYRVQRGLYKIPGKTSYTLITLVKHALLILYEKSYTVSLACENRPSFLCIVILMQHKI